jgi:hypothetical protein
MLAVVLQVQKVTALAPPRLPQQKVSLVVWKGTHWFRVTLKVSFRIALPHPCAWSVVDDRSDAQNERIFDPLIWAPISVVRH